MGISQTVLNRQLDTLAARDSDVARALDSVGYPETRHRPAGFATLFQVIVSQQVSTHAASAIWQKCQSSFGDTPDAADVAVATPERLRACGLSTRKCEYACDLAKHFARGDLSSGMIAGMTDEEAIAALTSVRGIGRWTAEIYLLFAEGRPDIWPADDLAVQVAYQRLKGLEERPRGRAFYALSEPWSPMRGSAAILMWAVYGSATLDSPATP